MYLLRLLVGLFDVELNCSRHGGGVGLRCFYVEVEVVVAYCFGRGGPKGCDARIVLLKVWEVVEKRLNARGAKERNHVVVYVRKVREVTWNGVVNYDFRELDFVLLHKVGNVIPADLRTGEKESFLLVALDDFKKLSGCALSREDFALAYGDVLLEVVRRLFRNAEVLHVCGNVYAYLLHERKEVVYRIAARKYYSRMSQYIYFLLAKLLSRYGFYFNERAEVNFQVEFFSQTKVRGVFCFRLGL